MQWELMEGRRPERWSQPPQCGVHVSQPHRPPEATWADLREAQHTLIHSHGDSPKSLGAGSGLCKALNAWASWEAYLFEVYLVETWGFRLNND